MTHPYNLAAIAEWHALDEAMAWILPTMVAEAQSRASAPPARTRTPDAVQLGHELRVAARTLTVSALISALQRGLTDTTKALGDVPGPYRPELTDARDIGRAARTQVLRLVHALDANLIEENRLPAPAALAQLDLWRAREAAETLRYATGVVLDVVRVPPAHVPYEGTCPGCASYGLVWETAAVDPLEWTVLCSYDCRCDGDACRCGLPIRVRGATHRWNPGLISPLPAGALSFEQAIEDLRAGR